MPVDLTPEPAVADLAKRTAAFVREVVVPVEERHAGVVRDDAVRAELQRAAREAGVFAPHVGVEHGGHGLDMRGRAAVFEEAGYSLLGPLALNIAAPDEGNMHLLEAVATQEQKQRYLAPLAAGDVRSCFAMTEPAPGAGSDPAALTTRAEKVAGGWRIDGRKWFITGADGAAFAICMARTSGAPGDRGGATMFLVDADNPGITLVRHIDTLDESLYGGHMEVAFDGCMVPDGAVLGEVDEGYRYAQVRLGPARMTHCMRWLGIARRAQDIAVGRARERELFGSRLADLGMVQAMIADNEIDIAASRGLILRACWELDQGGTAAQATAIAKTFTAEAVWRVVDRAVQICGSLGISGDVLLGRFLREVRPFRIYDGPSETHRWAIAKRVAGR
ncbi:acyl-CoA dehydrogenase [Pseudonocardia sp. CNS-004]|nr:acyl-CoA dehydrogenase [Pseudonocardia sp. CNS-004]